MAHTLDRDANQTANAGDELHPIRIGMVARQPQPDIDDVIHLGLAWLLPEALRSLCSCAGLFYARMLNTCAGGPLYRIEVAALLHYFVADPQTRQRHVREIFLPVEQVEQLLEWERRLAGLPTGDLRELVEAHAASAIPLLPVEPVSAFETTQTEASSVLAMAGDEEEADLAPLPTIFVSRAMIHESLETLEVASTRERYVQTALLHAILQTLAMQLTYCGSTRERRRLQSQYDQVCAVQQWRRLRHENGHGWQRVVTLEPAWEEGRAGWDIIVGVLLAA
ncbi:MAG: hypothetical protein ACRDIV_17560 [Ktedonobacteraceae bacterium]